MFKKIFFLLTLLTLYSFAKIPTWINDPYSLCKSNELCAVGEGTGHMMAEGNARNSLAKIFEVKINSINKISQSSSQLDIDGTIVGGEVKEEVLAQINEIADQLLQGVEIKAKFEGPEKIFALASLDKSKSSKRIKDELETLDTRIESHFIDGRRSHLNKALRIYYVRNDLHKRYTFLSERKYLPKISLRKILKKKSEKKKLNTVVFVSMTELIDLSDIKHLIISELLENDYKVVIDQKKNIKFKVVGSMTSTKQHMNVKGFEKHSFVLKLESQNITNKKIGGLEFSTTQIGRSYKQTYENALPFIIKFLREELVELNMD